MLPPNAFSGSGNVRRWRPEDLLRPQSAPYLHAQSRTQPECPRPEPHRPPDFSRRGPDAWVGESCLRCELWMRCLLDELIGPRGPSRSGQTSHLGVLQGAGPTAEQTGLGRSPWPRRVLLPFSHQKDHLFPTPSLQQLVPQAPAKQEPAREPESQRQGAVLKVEAGGARQALRRCPWSHETEIQMRLRSTG